MIKPEILIVEDEEYLNDFICTFLNMNGFSAVGAMNPLEAMKKIEELSPALIISDINMPQKNGLEFLHDLRKESLPCAFVLLTAYNDPELIFKALRLGALDYILKPFDNEKFLANASVWLEIGKRLQILSKEKDPDVMQKQLRMIEKFKLKCNALNQTA